MPAAQKPPVTPAATHHLDTRDVTDVLVCRGGAQSTSSLNMYKGSAAPTAHRPWQSCQGGNALRRLSKLIQQAGSDGDLIRPFL